jgi:hypothetical protein
MEAGSDITLDGLWTLRSLVCTMELTVLQMTMTYVLSFIDKVALSEASIYGIIDDDVRDLP